MTSLDLWSQYVDRNVRTTPRVGSDQFSFFDYAATGQNNQSAAGRAPRSDTKAASGSSASSIGALVAGQLVGAYAKFHAVQMDQIATRSQADQLGHQARMLELDYRFALREAEGALEAGQSQIAFLGLEGAQRRAAITASTAGRGVDVNAGGNAAEVQASQRLVEAIDVYNVNLASVRAANAARRQATAIANEARFARVSERNLRRTARYAMPEAQLIAGLGSLASSGSSAGIF